MHYQSVLVFLLSLFSILTAPVTAADCQNSGGVANGQCVSYYSNGGCDGSTRIGRYKPTCQGNCFQYDNFQAVKVAGDGTYGTSCAIYSDINCQNKVADSGNVVVGGGKCVNSANAKSMKCYYRC